jgi:hypothetical protein
MPFAVPDERSTTLELTARAESIAARARAARSR